MKLGITGSSGFVGGCLADMARKAGHEVTGFSRSPGPDSRRFAAGEPLDVSGLDAMVHLAGESILGLWTEDKKRRIRESRILGTRSVVEGMEKSPKPPKVLVCASAVGFYGDTGETTAEETTPAGKGFLAQVAREWEAEALRAEALGVRVVLLRIGFVLGKAGAMALIRPVFRAGLGGPLGNGRQWMSGIHVEDVAGMALWAAGEPTVRGPVNAVMHTPFRNSEFTKALAAHYHRPAILPAPSFAIRLALGELSHVLLDNCRVVPTAARKMGYLHRYPTLDHALKALP